MTIRVLIVDDSEVVRKAFENGLNKDPEIEVVGTASDPFIARNKIIELKPDVVTLDIEMPRMDGISFLGKLMKYYPIPVVIVSTLSSNNSPAALAAIDAGAVEVMSKPTATFKLEEVLTLLRDKVKSASKANMSKMQLFQNVPIYKPSIASKINHQYNKILLIGASTGGTQAIENIIKQLPALCPATVIVQHMPAGFTAAFSERLNGLYEMEVKEACDGDEIFPGRVLVAPGHSHVIIKAQGSKFITHLSTGPLVNRHRPSVEVLFNSGASVLKDKAVGVMLTGMGADGAQGMLKMKTAGAHTIAQDEASCVVFGMPKAAIECGAVKAILPLDKIAAASVTACKK
ncbi:MAG: chemotaxis response regulator protein-glutamate methylesterase [bacterium]|nr:chemotaxis response regulator protein-glutamate methylesterase [bacterium]